MEIKLESGRIDTRKWWDFDFSRVDESMTFDDAVDETRRLMVQAVSRQSVADVQVGAYLSGGVDSGAIAAIASQNVPRLFTFTCGFDMSRVTGIEANFDERRQAEQTAVYLRARHFECLISDDDIQEGVTRLVDHLEDPRLGMAYPNFFIAELASKLSKVVLSGAGGDELFGGYPWRYYNVFRSLDRDEYERNYFDYWQRLIPDSAQPTSLSPGLLEATRGGESNFEIFQNVLDQNENLRFDKPEDQITASLYFEARTFLHGILLVNDRISGAHGLEERVPFLDNDLVDFAMRVPVRHKLARLGEMKRVDENEIKRIKQNQAAFDDGKNVLRRSLAGFLPDEVLNRPKQGFSSPEASWYRGATMQAALQKLDTGGATAFLAPEFIRSVVGEHLSGAKNHRLLIWSILSLDQWAQRHFPGAANDMFAG